MSYLKNKKIYAVYIAAFALVCFAYFMRPEPAHAELIYQVLGNTSSGPGKTIAEVWTAIRDIINLAGIAFLIFIAFANILRINISNYAIKKVLPTLVLAIILANFSFLICRLLVDLANVACDLLINGTTGITGGTTTVGLMSPFDESRRTAMESQLVVNGVWQWGAAFKYIVLTLFANIATIFIFILAALFYIRNYVIYFLVSLSALAFMATVLPQTKSVFNMWWSNFWKWAFLPIVSLFWLWVGNRWVIPEDASDPLSLMAMAFSIVCLYLAITTPFKMGGTVMQQWGNLGKKVWGATGGAAGEYGKRKAGVWWSGQAGSTNKLNPLGHIARIRTNLEEAKKFDEEVVANNRQKALANLAKTRGGRNRQFARQKFGGDLELAEAETLAELQESERGKKWLEGRQEFLANLENAKSRTNRNFQRAEAEFRGTKTGQDLSADRERLNRETLVADQQIQDLQKRTTLEFLSNSGRFADDQNDPVKRNRKLLDDVILGMSRNLWLDEAVKKTQQDEVDKVFQSQLHLQGMGDIIKNLNDTLEGGDEKIDEILTGRIEDRIAALREKGRNGQLSTVEESELDDLGQEQLALLRGTQNPRLTVKREQIKTELQDQMNEVAQAAKDFVNANPNAEYLRGMVDVNATDAKNVIQGFAGLAVDQGFDAGIGKIISTRVGKLTSIEIKGDIEKRLDEKTVTEIARDLDPGTTTIGDKFVLADGRTQDATRALSNFREGKRYLNDPQTNREIEARMLALAKVAKQTSNADSPAAAAGLARMMGDQAAIEARRTFNSQIEIAARRDSRMRQYLIPENATGNEIRSTLESHMMTRGNTSRLAYSSIMHQPTMGTSMNPGQYLSTAFDTSYAGYHPTPQNPTSDENVSRLAQSLISEIRRSPGQELSYSKLARALGQNQTSVAGGVDSLQTFLSTQRTHFADDIAKAMGIRLRPELRRGFTEALSTLPRNATPEQVAEKVREIVPDSSPRIDEKTIAGAIGKSKNLTSTQKAIEVLAQRQNVDDHMPYLGHFGGMSRGDVEEQYRLLTNARGQVEHNPNTDEALNLTSQVLKQTGFAPAQAELASGPNQIDQLFMAQQAAEAALNAYDQTGRYNADHAVDNLANYFVQKQGRINRQPEPEAPEQPGAGLHQDIKPPEPEQPPANPNPTPPNGPNSS